MMRPKWDIDQTLESLIGQEVRVAAKSFSPTTADGTFPRGFVPVSNLFLPDNSQPAGLPVFFEGRLQRFCRRIGVVYVCLESPSNPETGADGTAPFRGSLAVILKGPAIVELAFPFKVERLPLDSDNYWRDLRVPRVQFEFTFTPDTEPATASRGSNGSLEPMNTLG